ncbi:MAG TPA: hypothetical protein VMW34_04350 [Anaerolineales bacterium]|nr:hypothetical protein [Anaerolineales bacterium]
MGTNYYFRYKICDGCGSYKERHVGKSSGGWKFLFRAYPEHYDRPIIKTKDDWDVFIAAHPNGCIVDEYELEHSIHEFWEMVESKQKEGPNMHYGEHDWIDLGYSFCSSKFS